MIRKGLFVAFVMFAVYAAGLSAQSSVKGHSVNGSTGIIVSPTARVGWEYSDFGLDFGYSFLYNRQMDHVPRVTLSLFRRAEVGMAFNIHENSSYNLLFHGKFQFFRDGGSSVAMGFNGEFADVNNNSAFNFTPYLVASYSGAFFSWPAVTTMVFGWHMVSAGEISSNFAFSMGFELALAPNVFKNYVFWITDFSNYSYSVSPMIDADDRGAFNTGIRIDPVKEGKFKLVFDFVGTDLLDSGRGFMASATFGIGL